MHNMKTGFITFLLMICSCILMNAQNPYLPMWEYVPDGEPYVFEDPDNPGKSRIYIYGSHDTRRTDYCGRDLVVWSAPVENPTQWRYDGVIFEVESNLLYAPDVAEVTDSETGRKVYYLYPNNEEKGRKSMVAKADRPDGPFEVCNWSKTDKTVTEGVIGFDPAVLVDDDGRVYAYWGIENSYAAEIDPQTMATLKPGTQVIDGMITDMRESGIFRFFEASSIRKIKDKYVFIYSRWADNGEFGLQDTPYTLAYAYSDSPLGPYTFGGTIIDARGRDTGLNGKSVYTAHPSGNTHGSIALVNGQWYVFYHRQTGKSWYSRQAMVAPISVEVEEGPGGRVCISEGEYTSEGFHTEGLDPLKKYSAGITCYYTGPYGAYNVYPYYLFSGSYVQPRYVEELTPAILKDPYNIKYNHNPVVNNTDGSVVGYKYFNFMGINKNKHVSLALELMPQGVDGEIEVMAGAPYESKGGVLVGIVKLSSDMPCKMCKLTTDVTEVLKQNGKTAIYLRMKSADKHVSLCELHYLRFVVK